nr:hypothetical protein [uncultured Sulfurimonas sp.]
MSKKGRSIFIEVKDKKVMKYLKSMYQDFKDYPVQNEEVNEFIDSLRKVVNNNKMNLISGGLIYDYVSSQLENDCDYYIEANLESQPNIPVLENIEMVKNLYKEWKYLNEWFEKRFSLKNSNYGLTTITLKEVV